MHISRRWKVERCIAVGACLVFLLAADLTGFLVSRGMPADVSGPPSYIGGRSYLHLLVNDPVFRQAMWDTVKWPVYGAALLLGAVWLLRTVLSRRCPRVPAAVWDVIEYGGLFLLTGSATVTTIRAAGMPYEVYSTQAMVTHVAEFPWFGLKLGGVLAGLSLASGVVLVWMGLRDVIYFIVSGICRMVKRKKEYNGSD